VVGVPTRRFAAVGVDRRHSWRAIGNGIDSLRLNNRSGCPALLLTCGFTASRVHHQGIAYSNYSVLHRILRTHRSDAALDGRDGPTLMRQGAGVSWTKLVVWYPAGFPQAGTL
jgi:hypothetical protein